jgi:integrase
MAIMGWSSVAMAKRYQHIQDSLGRDVASQIGGLLGGPPAFSGDCSDG